jgi:hypothetical protein
MGAEIGAVQRLGGSEPLSGLAYFYPEGAFSAAPALGTTSNAGSVHDSDFVSSAGTICAGPQTAARNAANLDTLVGHSPDRPST